MNSEEDAALLLLSSWWGVVFHTGKYRSPLEINWKREQKSTLHWSSHVFKLRIVCSAGDQRTWHACAFFVLKSLLQIQAKNEVPATSEALCLKPGSTARWYQMRPCAVWPLVFVQTDVLMCCMWLDYLIVLVNHVSWASISLDVSLRLSSHSLQALPRCDCPVSALCLPRSSFSGRSVLSSFWTATLLLAGRCGNALNSREGRAGEGRQKETPTVPLPDSAFSFPVLHCGYTPSSSGRAYKAQDRGEHCQAELFQELCGDCAHCMALRSSTRLREFHSDARSKGWGVPLCAEDVVTWFRWSEPKKNPPKKTQNSEEKLLACSSLSRFLTGAASVCQLCVWGMWKWMSWYRYFCPNNIRENAR